MSRRAKITCGTTDIDWDDIQHARIFWRVLHFSSVGVDYDKSDKSRLLYVLNSNKLTTFCNLSFKRSLPGYQTVADGVRIFAGLDSFRNTDVELERIITASCSFESTDPRDKVYALLNLFERDGLAIVPDYNASTTQVYVHVVKSMVKLTGSL